MRPDSRARRQAGAIGLFVLVSLVSLSATALAEPPAQPGPGAVSVIEMIRPAFSATAMAWVAAVFVLIASVQSRPLLSRYTFDGLMLAALSLVLLMRDETRVVAGDRLGWTAQAWAYGLLTVGVALFALRGGMILVSGRIPRREANLSDGAALVLLAAGVIVAFGNIVTAPLSDASRDGIVGAIALRDEMKLPYGDAPGFDSRAPLVYTTHKLAVAALPPAVLAGGEARPLRWDERSAWLSPASLARADLSAARLVNAVLLGLLLIGVAMAGSRAHSPAFGATAAALVCFFPGARECFVQPDVMIPAVLLVWATTVALLGGPSGFLSVLFVCVAGLASSYAWVLLPGMLAYYLRRGWHAVGAVVATVLGVAALLVGLPALVAPSLPRADGALAAGGTRPAYHAALTPEGTIALSAYDGPELPAAGPLAPAWRFLVDGEDARLSQTGLKFSLPPGQTADAILLRQLSVDGPSGALLQSEYRKALAVAPAATRLWASLRTMLEQTWKPAIAPDRPRAGAWEFWSMNAGGADTWTLVRRISKVVLVLLALAVSALLFGARRADPHQLLGAACLLLAAAALVQEAGAVGGLVTPFSLLMIATGAHAGAAPAEAPSALGAAPRITIER